MRRFRLLGAFAAVVVLALFLASSAYAAWSWQGRVGSRTFEVTPSGIETFEVDVNWTSQSADLDIIVCDAPSRFNCDTVFARANDTQDRMERVTFATGFTFYVHVYAFSGGSKAVVSIINLWSGDPSNRPSTGVAIRDLGPGEPISDEERAEKLAQLR